MPQLSLPCPFFPLVVVAVVVEIVAAIRAPLPLFDVPERKEGPKAKEEGAEDGVYSLPGLSTTAGNFPHYSGYLQGSDEHFLHYWFIPSLHAPEKDPLLFWFNGGPGCSSMLGLLKEMGPFLVNTDGKTLRTNPNAWTNFANMVYIEAPAGVGYSYASGNASVDTDDDQTSEENYAAIKRFFDKFPSYRQHDVYITGESYAGVYVPTLAERIVKGLREFPLNLRGVAIGNGIMDVRHDFNSLYRFSVGHGLITQQQLDNVYHACCGSENISPAACDLYNAGWDDECGAKKLEHYFDASGLFVYDIFHVCDPDPQHNSIRLAIELANKRTNSTLFSPTYFAHLLEKANKHGKARQNPLACLDDNDLEDYLNSDEVRKALHIHEGIGRWHMCGMDGSYTKIHRDMSPEIKGLLEAGLRVLLYYGDTDAACNFMGGEEFCANLGLQPSGGRVIWRFNDQTAGFKQLYAEGNLTFVTVLGAGHMAPQWRPHQTNHAVRQFLRDQPI